MGCGCSRNDQTPRGAVAPIKVEVSHDRTLEDSKTTETRNVSPLPNKSEKPKSHLHINTSEFKHESMKHTVKQENSKLPEPASLDSSHSIPHSSDSPKPEPNSQKDSNSPIQAKNLSNSSEPLKYVSNSSQAVEIPSLQDASSSRKQNREDPIIPFISGVDDYLFDIYSNVIEGMPDDN